MAVIDICDSERASELRELIWSDLEGMNTDIRRDDPDSWKNDNLPQHTHGLFQNQHIGLRRGVSTARLETEQTWKNLFGGLQCISSFDAIGWSSPLMQSREYKRELKAQKANDDPVMLAEWLHTDQSPKKTACGLHYQGAFALTDLGQAEKKTQLVVPRDGTSLQEKKSPRD